MWDRTRQGMCEHTALILNKRLLGRMDDFRQGVDNRIEVVSSRLSLSATEGSSARGHVLRRQK